MKPMIILPPDTMSPEDIKELRENGVCVVVSKDPAGVKFVDPIPAQSSRTEIEDAAIKLSRILLNRMWGGYTSESAVTQGTIARIWVDCLIRGTRLDEAYVDPKVRDESVFQTAKHDELRRLAREEAKAERAAAKAAKAKEEKK